MASLVALSLTALLVTANTASQAAGVIVPVSDEACAEIHEDPESGGRTLECPGLGGYRLVVDRGDRGDNLVIERGASSMQVMLTTTVALMFNAPLRSVEWRYRLVEGRTRPHALIVAMRGEAGTTPELGYDRLVAIRVGPERSCVLGVVEAGHPQARELVLRMADSSDDCRPAGATPDRSIAAPAGAPRAQRPALKGMELYAWRTEAKAWRFALLVGTNRLKTEEEIRAAGAATPDLEALGQAISRLPRGELVILHNLAPMELPEAVISTVQRQARGRGVTLELHTSAAATEATTGPSDANPLLDADPATRWCVGPDGGALDVALPEPVRVREARLLLASGADYPTQAEWTVDLATERGALRPEGRCAPAWSCPMHRSDEQRASRRVRVSIGRKGSPPAGEAPRFCAEGLLITGLDAKGEALLFGTAAPPESGRRLLADLERASEAFVGCEPARLAQAAAFPFLATCRGRCEDEGERAIVDAAALAAECQTDAAGRALRRAEWTDLLSDVRGHRFTERLALRPDGDLSVAVNTSDTGGAAVVFPWRGGRWLATAQEGGGD